MKGFNNEKAIDIALTIVAGSITITGTILLTLASGALIIVSTLQILASKVSPAFKGEEESLSKWGLIDPKRLFKFAYDYLTPHFLKGKSLKDKFEESSIKNPSLDLDNLPDDEELRQEEPGRVEPTISEEGGS